MAFFHKPTEKRKPYTNIKSLKGDHVIQADFSAKLDRLLEKEPNVADIDQFETSLPETLCEASEEVIPKVTKGSKVYPWTNANFSKLIEQRRNCNDPDMLRELNTSIKKLRTKLTNDYFSNLANNINMASEQRKVEEEFRLCK